MKKQVVQLTETQLHSLIEQCVNEAMMEMDGVTYTRIYNASQNAKDKIQKGICQTPKTITKKHKKDGSLRKRPTTQTTMVDNDDIVSRATQMQSSVQQHWLEDYIGKTFKFFAQDRMGLVAHVLFSLEKVTKLDVNKTILVGNVVFNDKQISGDGITVDFAKNRIQYHERGSRYAYNLEIDKRFEPLWNKLLEQLKMALESRK